jgi:hypothetical protein
MLHEGNLMAQRAEKLPISELIESDSNQITARSIPRTGMPLNVELVNSPSESELEQAWIEEESWLVENARSLGAACGHTQSYIAGITDRVRDQVRQLLTGIEERAEKVKDEDTLQLLAVIGGIAVAAGVATRIWRSNRYE